LDIESPLPFAERRIMARKKPKPRKEYDCEEHNCEHEATSCPRYGKRKNRKKSFCLKYGMVAVSSRPEVPEELQLVVSGAGKVI
jgi:hypothetical protein